MKKNYRAILTLKNKPEDRPGEKNSLSLQKALGNDLTPMAVEVRERIQFLTVTVDRELSPPEVAILRDAIEVTMNDNTDGAVWCCEYLGATGEA